MATIRQIAAKAAELNTASDALADMQSLRAALTGQLSDLQTKIAAQQGIVQRLRTDLNVLVNEP